GEINELFNIVRVYFYLGKFILSQNYTIFDTSNINQNKDLKVYGKNSIVGNYDLSISKSPCSSSE
ncbi:hypothetical protein, partial [Dysgonomonas sp. HGC4]|uniref:hypothetical protein n=1 Tax=Dysgonomonas sp. HGC4 TaxID=1658009 RepID=UPI001C87D34C